MLIVAMTVKVAPQRANMRFISSRFVGSDSLDVDAVLLHFYGS